MNDAISVVVSPFRPEARECSLRAKTQGSFRRYERARRSLAGGVSTSMRSSAKPYPLYFSHGCGARLIDVDENPYIDYTLAWGPAILGHAHPDVAAAIARQAARGTTYGAQHDLEYEVAERLVALIPCAEAVCFANSGTEIVQLALRLARAATGRARYIKFEGHYHGWDDTVLVSYHPSREQIERSQGNAIPVGAGQLPSPALIARWNDCASVEQAFETHKGEISAIICEPLLANSGCIPPEPGFLEFLRETADAHGALLIFDEVITGFRLGIGGAQGYYGVIPDLATYGKAVGGGAPVSILAGKARYMDMIGRGAVVHAGTFNGNPIALAAAKVALDILAGNNGELYREIFRNGERLSSGIVDILRARGLPAVLQGLPPVFTISFAERPAHNYGDTLVADRKLCSDFALALLDEGILVLPDGRWYVSAAHREPEIDATLAAVRRTLE